MSQSILTVPFGEVYRTTSGGTPSRKHQKYYTGNIPWVKSGELEDNILLDTEERITQEAIDNSSSKLFPKGTLLVALYGATIGKLGILGINATTNQAICAIFENNSILSKYTYYFLLYRRQKFISIGFGGAQPNISQDVIRKELFPLIPFEEQKQIVSTIDQLFSDLDNAVENLKKAREQLKIYRLAVLKYAFEGKLTSEWREKHKNTKSATEVLNDIIIKNKQPQLDLENTIELPQKWCYSSIINLVSTEKNSLKRGPFGSSIKKAFFVPSGYKVYEQQNAIKKDCSIGKYYIDKSKYEELVQFAVHPGDLIVSCAGTIGCITEVPEGAEQGVINQALLKLKLNSDIVDKKFFLFQYDLYVEKFMRAKSRGSAMNNMSSVKELKRIPFVLASFEEQKQVVAEIEDRLSVCDKIETTIEETLQKSEVLRQNILKQAFEGKLTEKWRKGHQELITGENSAEALLAKIKFEKETLNKNKRKKHD